MANLKDEVTCLTFRKFFIQNRYEMRKNLPRYVRHKATFLINNDGYSACPIPTQYGKLMLAEFDYTNKPKMTFPFDQAIPRWSMWMLKTKVVPWLYWNKFLKGTA